MSSAPEEFQKRIHEAFDGLPGVASIADDMLIFGIVDTQEEAEANHDLHLVAFMERVQRCSLKLNPNKIKFRLRCITFMGHRITEDGTLPDPN